MDKLIMFIIIFLIANAIYWIFIRFNKKVFKKFEKSTEVNFLVKKYKLNIKKIGVNKMFNYISLINSFIISTAFILSEFFDNIIIKTILTFIFLIILILICYHILGKALVKKYESR